MKSKIAFAAGLTAGVLVAMSATLIAGQVTGLIDFTAGTPAKASEVNGNFTAVKTAVDDNNARIAALEALLAGVTRTTLNGEPTVRFSGVNVQIVNGLGSTTGTNGKGNLIVGYDEPRGGTTFFCSIGTDLGNNPISPSNSPTPPAACTAAGGTWAVSHKSGSHYLVVGDRNNYSQAAGIVVGTSNTSNNTYASVSGGQLNTASGTYASVSGGSGNTASALFTSASGGINNTASRQGASVSGGDSNIASGQHASVSGGLSNTASGDGASVSGGVLNTAGGDGASVSGGRSNTAGGGIASVSGGQNNTAGAAGASVSGGDSNTASGSNASVSGGRNNSAGGSAASVSGGRGCDSGATSDKWFVGDTGTFSCNATLQN